MKNTQKKYYYVQVTSVYCKKDANDNESFFCEKTYVTSVDHTTKYAHWKKGEKPLALSKFWAEDLCQGLIINFHEAQVVMSYYELSERDNLINGNHNEEKKEVPEND